MNPSPLELERYFFTKVHVDAITGSSSKATSTVKAAVNLKQRVDDKRRFLVQVDVTISATAHEPAQYRGDISVVGYFKVDPSYQKDPAELAGRNGAAILYSAAREMLANITARGPWPTFALPWFSFKTLSIVQSGKTSKSGRGSAQISESVVTKSSRTTKTVRS